jgi:hypothetical protein
MGILVPPISEGLPRGKGDPGVPSSSFNLMTLTKKMLAKQVLDPFNIQTLTKSRKYLTDKDKDAISIGEIAVLYKAAMEHAKFLNDKKVPDTTLYTILVDNSWPANLVT